MSETIDLDSIESFYAVERTISRDLRAVSERYVEVAVWMKIDLKSLEIDSADKQILSETGRA